MELQDINILVEDVHNANEGTEKGREIIANSIADTGLHRGIVVDKDNRIVAGNKTFREAKKQGYTKIKIVDNDDGKVLVVTKRNDFNLADNSPDNKARKAAYFDNTSAFFDISFDADVVLADKMAGVDFESLGLDEVSLDAILNGNSFIEDEASLIESPESFKEYDDDIETEYCCPKCNYEWSGQPK